MLVAQPELEGIVDTSVGNSESGCDDLPSAI